MICLARAPQYGSSFPLLLSAVYSAHLPHPPAITAVCVIQGWDCCGVWGRLLSCFFQSTGIKYRGLGGFFCWFFFGRGFFFRRKENKTGPACISLWCLLNSLVKCCGGTEGLSRDVHFGWLWAICPSSHQKAFSPLPIQANICMSACSLPFQHPWRSWSRDSLGGCCPQLSNRWQLFSSELGRAGAGGCRRAPDVRVGCATALPSGSAAGEHHSGMTSRRNRASFLRCELSECKTCLLLVPWCSCGSVSICLVCSLLLSVGAVAYNKD